MTNSVISNLSIFFRLHGWLGGAIAAALVVVACGGGSGSDASATAPIGGTPTSGNTPVDGAGTPVSGGGTPVSSGASDTGGTPAGGGTSSSDTPSAIGTPITASVPPSNRIAINLGQTPWRYLKDRDPPNAMSPAYDDSAANTQESWSSVGVPQSPSDNDTFLNMASGGGQGQLTGSTLWYRKHFTLDASYSTRKIFVEFEGAHTGAQVYINGTFIPGNSLVNPLATHVVGFLPFIVDISNYVKFDGSDNVLAVKVARQGNFFKPPNFSGAFRFGQADSGLFRPLLMYITDRVHIPRNTYAVSNTGGTYVSTLSSNDNAAIVRVQTNVRNEYAIDQPVTLTTQTVDAKNNVVASAQDTKVA